MKNLNDLTPPKILSEKMLVQIKREANKKPVRFQLASEVTCSLVRGKGVAYEFQIHFKKTTITIIYDIDSVRYAIQDLVEKRHISFQGILLWKYDKQLFSRESPQAKIFKQAILAKTSPEAMALLTS